MIRDEQSLRALARFDNLLHKANLLLGLRMWLRSVALSAVIVIAAGLLGLWQFVPPLEAQVFLMIFLMQWSAGLEAGRAYGFRVSSWCWWSILWRVALYYWLPLAVLLTITVPPEQLQAMFPGVGGAGATSREVDAQGGDIFLLTQLLTSLLSVVPMGLASSRAFLVSLERIGGAGAELAAPRDGNDDAGEPPSGDPD